MPAKTPEPVVEVVYATADEQRIVRVPFAPGLTAEQAARDSGLLDALPEIAAHTLVLGVFGVPVGLRHPLAAGDRVEICRPLQRDPRDRRRYLAS